MPHKEQDGYRERLAGGESVFVERLRRKWDEGKYICVGLDSDYRLVPEVLKQNRSIEETLRDFNLAIVEQTADSVCAYKLNSAFYEALGVDGYRAMRETVFEIKKRYPEVTVIVDAKRADIGTSSKGYARAVFDELGADAVTVHPYLGREALEPFLEREDKGIIVLCRTSNPGAGEFQDLRVYGEPLYMRVARAVGEEWNERGNCALVVGATYPQQMREIRRVAPMMPFLVPGVGSQGGEIGRVMSVGRDAVGQGLIVNSSRQVIYASANEDFALAAREEVLRMDVVVKVSERESGWEAEMIGDPKKKLMDGLLEIGAVRFGEFRLKLHDEYPEAPLSPIYVDLRLIRRHPEVKRWAVVSMSQMIESLEFDLLADIPTGSSFLVASLCDELGVGMVTPRVKEKKHGTGAKVDGMAETDVGKRVLVIDDLVTRADSKIEVAEIMRGEGLEVLEVAVLLDREQGGREQLSMAGMELRSVLGLCELLDYYVDAGKMSGEERKRIDERLRLIDEYFSDK